MELYHTGCMKQTRRIVVDDEYLMHKSDSRLIEYATAIENTLKAAGYTVSTTSGASVNPSRSGTGLTVYADSSSYFNITGATNVSKVFVNIEEEKKTIGQSKFHYYFIPVQNYLISEEQKRSGIIEGSSTIRDIGVWALDLYKQSALTELAAAEVKKIEQATDSIKSKLAKDPTTSQVYGGKATYETNKPSYSDLTLYYLNQRYHIRIEAIRNVSYKKVTKNMSPDIIKLKYVFDGSVCYTEQELFANINNFKKRKALGSKQLSEAKELISRNTRKPLS